MPEVSAGPWLTALRARACAFACWRGQRAAAVGEDECMEGWAMQSESWDCGGMPAAYRLKNSVLVDVSLDVTETGDGSKGR